MAVHSFRTFQRKLLSVQVQGAMAVARATLRALVAQARSLPPPRTQSGWVRFSKQADVLATVRPTEPLARNVTRWFVEELYSYAGTTSGQVEWRRHSASLGRAISEYLNEVDEVIVTSGRQLVRSKQTIFTH